VQALEDRHLPLINVYSRHPLAIQLIERILATDNELSASGFVVCVPNNPTPSSGRAQVLILDACSESKWMETAIRWHQVGAKIIVLFPGSAMTHAEQIQALYVGISGLVRTSGEIGVELPRAVRSVLGGELWISRNVLEEYARRTSAGRRHDNTATIDLTLREEQMMTFLLAGYSNKEIAKSLCISERTVKYHVSNILRKEQVTSRKSLVATSRNC
jgi:DNA-binding NarL/FixJ family response regulator